jgi:RHS repeat-associated protein
MDHITRVLGGGIDESYEFDGMGRRVGTTTGASVKRFLIAPNLGSGYESPQAVTDGSGNLIASYVYAGEHPIMKVNADGTVEYLLEDSTGSVIAKADNSGGSTATIKYTVFGEVVSAVGPASGIDPAVGTEHRLHGMMLDATTGLYYVRARSYDPRTGRFASRDPVAGARSSPEALNPYTFNRNNPTIWIDPSGRISLTELMTVGVIRVTLALTATAAFAAWVSKPVKDPNSKEALEKARTYGVGVLCGLRAFDWSLADQREATMSWLVGQTHGASRDDYIYSREWDAFGHCWSACNLCRRCGQSAAWQLGDTFEDVRDLGFSPWSENWRGPHDSSSQDRNNHSIGITVATEEGTCGENCARARLDLSAPPGDSAWDITNHKGIPMSEVPPL